ncbi:MAG: hypothetical protein D3923_19915, partial [Candidatus Electrothrix sp. AR3]|nr:hypothetical protein [Candidatus Electrothrix sp. AR3]
MQLLTVAEENQFRQELDEERHKEAQLGKEIAEKNAALAWRAKIKKLQTECILINQEQHKLQQELLNFFEDEKRLSLAQQALGLE